MTRYTPIDDGMTAPPPPNGWGAIPPPPRTRWRAWLAAVGCVVALTAAAVVVVWRAL
jgi:hypothetical protein